jgi:sugar phosphate isomerase/epimerase
MKPVSRRTFVQESLALAAAAAAAEPASVLFNRARAAAPPTRALRLGGPAFPDSNDPEPLALAHRKLGYRAAYCPNVALTDTDRIRAYAEAFAKHDVVIAEVGRWYNLLDPDATRRSQNLKRVTDGLALAEAIGALCCVDIAGSYNPTTWYGPHPDNLSQKFFDAIVENARKIIDEVKPKRAKFVYEAMGWSLPDNPDNYVKLIKAIDRPAFGVHLDPCNMVNSPEKFYHNSALLNECFDKLGQWIVSCHGKDLAWETEMNVHFKEVGPGKGSLDYATYLRRLAALPQNPPLMLEHLTSADTYSEAREHVFAVGRQAGLTFE